MIYCAYAQSLLSYGILVWVGALNSHIKKLFVIQKHIIRAATGKNRFSPSTDLFVDFNVLTVRQLYVSRLINYIILSNLNKFKLRENTFNLRSTAFSVFATPRVGLHLNTRQIDFVCTKLINVIPPEFLNFPRCSGRCE